ncbi:EmrB/QacA subfamily drug resistance transporter [Paenibacillus amylolyticus]|uniref:EmrB/QacA subfamily drug resistance transporter n=1 Tax=Paenibacillus amylolyticus TaxID=1451 RepID=A0AAP5LQF2_PAEAM|nr:MFS transporter [Paenibacillus amylolyticus]MDR6725660.1 EmrB/QacA subfamily drug resistance transporter [Paenibacillus amylolyticus]
MKLSLLKGHAVLWAILTGAFALVLTNSAFNLLLPYFVQHYDISTTAGGWIIVLYMLAMTLTMPMASLIVDRLGRKQTYMLGICLYGIFSIIGALFHAYFEVLLIVRFVHGVAAGLMIPLSLVLLFDYYGTEVRGRITGAWGMLLMLAPTAGPTLGGFIIEYGRLEYLFWLNVPFAVFSLILCGSYIQVYLPARRKRWHLSSMILLIGGIGALSLGLQLYASPIVGSGVPWSLMAVGIALLIRFIQTENRRKEPLIRYQLLRRNKVFPLTVLVSTIQDCVMFGVIFALPLLFQDVFHMSPALSGALFIPLSICTSLFMWIGGSLMDRGRSLQFIAWGTALVAFSIVSFAFLPLNTPLIILVLLMACRGIGVGLSGMSISALGLQALSEEDMHEGSALSTTIERLASSFAIMGLTLFYDMRWQWLAQTGASVEMAKWGALREICIVLGSAILLTLPLVLLITRKKVGLIVRDGKQAPV